MTISTLNVLRILFVICTVFTGFLLYVTMTWPHALNATLSEHFIMLASLLVLIDIVLALILVVYDQTHIRKEPDDGFW